MVRKQLISAVRRSVYVALLVMGAGSAWAQCVQWTPSGSSIFVPVNCKVGIGTSTPADALDVRDGDVTFTSSGVAHGITDILPTNAYFTFTIDTIGSGGVDLIGATSTTSGVPFSFIGVHGTSTPPAGNAAINFSAMKKAGTSWQALAANETAFRYRSLITDLMVIMGSGNVGIGTTTPTEKLDIVGNLKVSGDITGARVIGAVYQDVAEWVPSTENLEPGTVVVLNPSHDNQVMPSAAAYDTTVAGVVSAQPGVILGIGSESKEMVATTGRVKVKVSAAGGAINIGDLLVTSDKRGVAMKSQPVDLAGGLKLHRPGTIIGKALQALPAGEGEILVLLSMQ